MEKKVVNYIKKFNMLDEGDKVLAGVSGGADSMCLLLVLLKIKNLFNINISVVHVNHGLRGKAAQLDAEFVEQICGRFNVECIVRNVNVKDYAAREKQSEEEAARNLRYKMFASVCRELQCTKIAVAHHADDQAETVLFQMFRGSGLKGLSGMLPVRDNIIRPLLCVSRAEIEDFLKQSHMEYCTDATNYSVDYTRNKIRLNILPYIKDNINEGVVSHLISIADDARRADLFLQREAQKIFNENSVIEDGVLKLNLEVLKYEEIIVSYVLRMCIEKVKSAMKDIGRKHIEDIYNIAHIKGNKEIMLPYGIRVYKEYSTLIFKRQETEISEEQPCFTLSKEKILNSINGISIEYGNNKIVLKIRQYEKNIKYTKTKYTNCFDYDKIKNVLSLRARAPGDFIVIHKNGEKKKLKNYFIDEKIPKNERDKLLIVADGSQVIWIVGYRMSENYKVTEDTKYVLQMEIDGG